MIRGRIVALSFLSFQSGRPPCVLLLVISNNGMFSLNSIDLRNKCGLLAFWREIQRRMCKANVLKSLYRRLKCILTQLDDNAWSDKMNKEQSADDPSVDLIHY